MEENSPKKELLEVKTGGQWFMRLLKLKGVNFVFGTTGAGMPDIQDAMVVEKPPKWIQGLHEFTTVSAAAGYALSSGREGVALIDRIVGTQNAIGALFGAYMNSAPLVVLASANVPGVPIQTGAPELHYSFYQSVMVLPWVKWTTQVNSLESMPEDVEKAFFMALAEHPAPVYLTLRQDLMAQTVERGWTAQSSASPSISPRVPDDSTVEKIVDKILSHDSPVLVTSQVGRHPQAVATLVEFAHALGVGVMERRFFMNYPVSDSLHLGFLTRYQDPEIPERTDLLIALELGLLPNQNFKNVDLVDIASDPFHRQDVYAGGDYGASLVPATIRAVCDSHATLQKILKRVHGAEKKEKINERLAKFSEEHEAKFVTWRRKAVKSYESNKLDDWSVGFVLDKHLKDEAIWVNGAASSWETLLKSFRVARPGSYFGNGSGHLGITIGMAYGVALAQRNYTDVRDMGSYKIGRISGNADKIVVCTTGDGDAIFGNIDSALWTCAHYGIGVLYVILNNACWAAEWRPIAESTEHWAKTAGDYEFLDLENPRIDFSSVAKGFGVYSKKVETVEQFDLELPKAVEVVRKNDKPALIDVQLEKFTVAASVVP